MIHLKDLGNFETVPQIVSDILEGQLPALNEHFKREWDIEEKIEIGQYASYTPLEYALVSKCFASVKWLVEQGVNLNAKHNHSFLQAVRYCDEDIIRYLLAHGTAVESDDPDAPDAFMQALYGNKPENLPLIQEFGHTVRKYGGRAFAYAVNPIGNRPDYNVLDFFVQNGVDVNFKVSSKDVVYPWQPTPLCIAARYSDLQMCKYLVAHGADVTLAEKDGMRPYSIAVEKGDMEMAAYFKALEPAAFHSLQNKLTKLKSYKLPKSLLNFLQSDNLRLDFGKQESACGSRFVDFFALIDTIPMRISRQKVLRISRDVDNYSDLYIVWNPKTKQIAFYDNDHEIFHDIATFDDFMKNTQAYMQKVISGELDA